MTSDEAFTAHMEERRIHKAVAGTDPQHCAICGQRIKPIPGGQGSAWAHTDSGAVAAPNPPGVDTENVGRNKDRPLTDIMEFDHVIHVYKDGQITSVPNVYAPELHDEELQTGDKPWQLMNGYSGQQSYRGPVMHNSEFIGGGMERDIRSTPGLYVSVVAHWSPKCTECDQEAWLDDNEVAHHAGEGIDGIDHDQDADHVALIPEDDVEGWGVAYIHDDE